MLMTDDDTKNPNDDLEDLTVDVTFSKGDRTVHNFKKIVARRCAQEGLPQPKNNGHSKIKFEGVTRSQICQIKPLLDGIKGRYNVGSYSYDSCIATTTSNESRSASSEDNESGTNDGLPDPRNDSLVDRLRSERDLYQVQLVAKTAESDGRLEALKSLRGERDELELKCLTLEDEKDTVPSPPPSQSGLDPLQERVEHLERELASSIPQNLHLAELDQKRMELADQELNAKKAVEGLASVIGNSVPEGYLQDPRIVDEMIQDARDKGINLRRIIHSNRKEAERQSEMIRSLNEELNQLRTTEPDTARVQELEQELAEVKQGRAELISGAVTLRRALDELKGKFVDAQAEVVLYHQKEDALEAEKLGLEQRLDTADVREQQLTDQLDAVIKNTVSKSMYEQAQRDLTSARLEVEGRKREFDILLGKKDELQSSYGEKDSEVIALRKELDGLRGEESRAGSEIRVLYDHFIDILESKGVKIVENGVRRPYEKDLKKKLDRGQRYPAVENERDELSQRITELETKSTRLTARNEYLEGIGDMYDAIIGCLGGQPGLPIHINDNGLKYVKGKELAEYLKKTSENEIEKRKLERKLLEARGRLGQIEGEANKKIEGLEEQLRTATNEYKGEKELREQSEDQIRKLVLENADATTTTESIIRDSQRVNNERYQEIQRLEGELKALSEVQDQIATYRKLFGELDSPEFNEAVNKVKRYNGLETQLNTERVARGAAEAEKMTIVAQRDRLGREKQRTDDANQKLTKDLDVAQRISEGRRVDNEKLHGGIKDLNALVKQYQQVLGPVDTKHFREQIAKLEGYDELEGQVRDLEQKLTDAVEGRYDPDPEAEFMEVHISYLLRQNSNERGKIESVLKANDVEGRKIKGGGTAYKFTHIADKLDSIATGLYRMFKDCIDESLDEKVVAQLIRNYFTANPNNDWCAEEWADDTKVTIRTLALAYRKTESGIKGIIDDYAPDVSYDKKGDGEKALRTYRWGDLKEAFEEKRSKDFDLKQPRKIYTPGTKDLEAQVTELRTQIAEAQRGEQLTVEEKLVDVFKSTYESELMKAVDVYNRTFPEGMPEDIGIALMSPEEFVYERLRSRLVHFNDRLMDGNPKLTEVTESLKAHLINFRESEYAEQHGDSYEIAKLAWETYRHKPERSRTDAEKKAQIVIDAWNSARKDHNEQRAEAEELLQDIPKLLEEQQRVKSNIPNLESLDLPMEATFGCYAYTFTDCDYHTLRFLIPTDKEGVKEDAALDFSLSIADSLDGRRGEIDTGTIRGCYHVDIRYCHEDISTRAGKIVERTRQEIMKSDLARVGAEINIQYIGQVNK